MGLPLVISPVQIPTVATECVFCLSPSSIRDSDILPTGFSFILSLFSWLGSNCTLLEDGLAKGLKQKVRGFCSGSPPEASAAPDLKGSPTPASLGTPRLNGPLCCFRRLNFLHLHEILSCVVPA